MHELAYAHERFWFSRTAKGETQVITVTLVGPDKVRSTVKISEDTTVRDVATSKYHLFWRTTKKNGTNVVPFTTRVVDGDSVTVENE